MGPIRYLPAHHLHYVRSWGRNLAGMYMFQVCKLPPAPPAPSRPAGHWPRSLTRPTRQTGDEYDATHCSEGEHSHGRRSRFLPPVPYCFRMENHEWDTQGRIGYDFAARGQASARATRNSCRSRRTTSSGTSPARPAEGAGAILTPPCIFQQ
jgi:hypothetical protein